MLDIELDTFDFNKLESVFKL